VLMGALINLHVDSLFQRLIMMLKGEIGANDNNQYITRS